MHGVNLSTVPELLGEDASLVAPDANLGGMRNLLPNPTIFGAGRTRDELHNLMRKLAVRMDREPDWPDRLGDVELNDENPNIPSGFTYLLQLIAHDMVNTSISLSATEGRRFGFTNARRQPLMLDTIFGGGPDVSPQAYAFTERCSASRGLLPRTRLRTGRAQDSSGNTLGMPYADLGRATPLAVRDSGVPASTDAARCLRTDALVADARNEDQALIAQMTALFHRLHNFILDQIESGRGGTSASDAYMNFISARFILTLLYRRIILRDVLRRLLNPSVWRYYVVDAGALVADDGSGDVPVEFSYGAFRCGHAMVRNGYRLNSSNELPTSRAMQLNSQRSPAFLPLTQEWVIRWERFFQIAPDTQPNYSRRLGPKFSPIVRSEFYFPPLQPGPAGNGDAAGLPSRDLTSAVYAQMWSVPRLIDALRAKSRQIAAFLPPYSEYREPLRAWLNQTANPDGISEQLDAGDIAALVEDPPLPFFVLFEAALNRTTPRIPFKEGGQSLGPLGSIIVAESILAAMNANQLQIKDLKFDPMQRLATLSPNLRQIGVTEAALSRLPDIDTMDELIMFMEKNGALYDNG
jgi:hypothetical protein